MKDALFAILLLLSSATLANEIDDANKAYNSGDYHAALVLFTEQAKLGYAEAQYKVGKLWMNGEAGHRDLVYAHAYLSLALTNKNGKYQGVASNDLVILDRMMTDEQKDAAERTVSKFEKEIKKNHHSSTK